MTTTAPRAVAWHIAHVDASDATPAIAEHQETYDLGTMDDWNAVDASGTPGQTLQRCLASAGIDPKAGAS